MVELFAGPWWEKLEIDEKTLYVRRYGDWVPLEE